MAVKWEMIMIHGDDLRIWSPGKPDQRLSLMKYMAELGLISEDHGFVTYLLENGFEPYSSHDFDWHFFKRRLRP